MFSGGVTSEVSETTEAVRGEYWSSLHERLVAGAKARLALEAAEARDLVYAEEAELWRRFGYTSMVEYMQRELFYEPHTARERLRVANKLFELPLLAEGFRNGELSFSALRELTRVVVPETEEEWLERAKGKTSREVERLVSGLREGASPDDRPDPRLVRHRISFDVDGETFALWCAKRVALDDERGQRMTDIEVVQEISRVSTTGDRTPSPTLHAVTTCRVCKQSSLVAGGLETPLGEASRERLLCDTADAGDLEGDEVQRLTPEIPAPTRRRVMIRDRFGCTVPGCTSRRHLDLHHVIFRSNGGAHTMRNLTALCSGHHREAHEGLLRIHGIAPDRLVFEFRREGDDEPHRILTTATDAASDEDSVPRGTVRPSASADEQQRGRPRFSPAWDRRSSRRRAKGPRDREPFRSNP